jgi:hypothetical protein
MHPWLLRLRHDLVKRAVWVARDLSQAGEARPGDLVALRRGLFDLRNDEGLPATAQELWARLRPEAPGIPASSLDAFAAALAQAEGAVAGGDPRAALDAVLHLEDAFSDLARTLEEE